MKKIFTALFAFVATLTASAQAWDGTAAIWTNGDGTEANPYLIAVSYTHLTLPTNREV